MHYRKYYKMYYDIDFDSNYEIHHIDRNKNNNHIDNLLLLPKELHRELHMLKRDAFLVGLNNNKIELDLTLINGIIFSSQLSQLARIVEVYSKISEYVDYKYLNYKNGVGGKLEWQ